MSGVQAAAAPEGDAPFAPEVLGVLMPMHVHVSATGQILSVGPTLAKLRHEENLVGQRLLEVFEIKRPLHILHFADLLGHGNCLVRTRFRYGDRLGMKGLCVPLSSKRLVPHERCASKAAVPALLNLSFGVNIVEAVQRYNLSSADFAPADPTIDMLYLIEAKSVALEESKRLNSRLEGARVEAEMQASIDMLTGLQNRRSMDAVLRQLESSGQPFGLMHLDLDHFKQVNDTLGHGAGDHVLRFVAAVLQDETRAGDLVARAGGDEFVLIFKGCVDLTMLEGIAWRIIARLEEPITYDGQLCQISASIGTTLSSFYRVPSAERMLNDADRALYTSKDKGRARHTVFNPEHCDTMS